MAAPILARLEAIQVKLEAAKGTAETTGFTDILVYDMKMTPTSGYDRRGGAGACLGNNTPGVVTDRTGTSSFSMELSTTGSAGLNAGLAILFQACGLAQTSEVYQVHSTFANQKTITIKYFQGGLLRVLYGAMGNVTISGEQGKRVMCAFDFSGIYTIATDVALPAFAPTSRQPMKFGSVDGTHVAAFTLNSAAKNISKFQLNLQNEVGFRSSPAGVGGIGSAIIGHYDPQLTIDPEADAVATYAFESLWLAGTEHAVSILLSDGTDKVTFTLPKVQAKSVPMGVRENILVYEWVGQCNHSSGNDSVAITVAAD